MTVRIDALIFQPMDAGSPTHPLRTARRPTCRAPPCIANAARRAVQKPGVCASSLRRNRAALRDDFKQKHTPPFRSAHRRKNGCPHRKRLQRRAPYEKTVPESLPGESAHARGLLTFMPPRRPRSPITHRKNHSMEKPSFSITRCIFTLSASVRIVAVLPWARMDSSTKAQTSKA